MTDPTTLTRRAALAGAAALPARSLPQAATVAQSADPAVIAFRAWRAAWQVHSDYLYSPDNSDDNPEGDRLHDAEWQARKALAETIATTPAGIACQLRLALEMFGEHQPGTERDGPESYASDAKGDELDGKLMRSLLAGAERLA